jgi:Trypsin-like peptidase domain
MKISLTFKGVCLLFICLALLLIGMDTTASSINDAYKSAVQITNQDGFAGSGTLINLNKENKQLVITAAHVVSESNSEDIKVCGVHSEKCSLIETIQIVPDKDIALLTLNSNKENQVADSAKVMGKWKPKLGNKLIVSGSPAGIPITGTGELVLIKGSSGIVNFACVGGSSGGGVFYQGKLVGVVIAVPVYNFWLPAMFEDLCVVELF